MEDIDIPHYFICPISLQIMMDPVTVITGITYDRESIEKWLSSGTNTACPVTNQPLPRDSDLTPNHTLRRLLQAWCMINASHGVDRIPTPKSPLNKFRVAKILQNLNLPLLRISSLNMLVNLASESERNRRCMVDSGVVKAIVLTIKRFVHENTTQGLQEALTILSLVPMGMDDISPYLMDLCDSVTWILRHNDIELKTRALTVLKSTIDTANSNLLDQLKYEFFEAIIQVLRDGISPRSSKYVLCILLGTCAWGRNKMKIIDAGAVLELIELELTGPDKRTTELVFGVLDHLCSCADGRARFLTHAASIAVVTKRILRVSPMVDDGAVRILAWICKFSATKEVLQEMLRVGGVAKLCMVLQTDCTPVVKGKARGVLRSHSNLWSGSPCVNVYLKTRDPKLQ